MTDGPTSSLGASPVTEPARPAKKRRSRLKIALGVFLVFVLLIGGCSVFAFKAIKGAADEGNRFLVALNQSSNAASKRTCANTGLDAAALDAIRDYLTKNGWDGTKSLRGSSVAATKGTTTGEVTGTVHLKDGDRAILLNMRKKGSWCVAGIHVAGPDTGATVGTGSATTDSTTLK